ncbi:beta-1,6-N-acetylglucosaminyltransferase [Dyadobacter sp. CY345]|uniref:beta-1,6-N-acetylglucosaminyltransferase n=1 Tax=Dyadobacter sp. CY345 TaxID=2909335 RepID=UPI001F18377A|nr:beta-1,6-N-acetylglucosaminyltransferase [Dyadobacter sp. CY345]MCF2444147.1 beta-1,6-N-acetylglucosaminyltransferase [Dyadobacter sp. CY345]
MKIAHLILAHCDSQQLGRLIDRLQNPDAFFFIHIDKKTELDSFMFLKDKKQVYFVKDRVNVGWGAYSIIEATINGFKEILSSDLCVDYVNLLSGADYPLKKASQIHQFFEEHSGQNFMEYLSVYDEWTEAIPRLTEYHLTNYAFPGKYVAQKWLNRLTPTRKMPNNLIPVGKSQWFSISVEAVKFILNYLEKYPEVVRFFKLTWAPDEIIFQTILYNSEFKDRLVNNNLRYIDWSAGKASPEILTEADLPTLKASNALFARKFSMSKHPEIMDLLD